MGARAGAVSRGEIHAAARRVFARTGLDGATLDAVAAEAGMDADALRARYPDKEAIVRDLIGEWIAEDRRTLPPAPPPLPRLASPASPPPPTATPPDTKGRGGVQENTTLAADVAKLAVIARPPTIRGDGGTPLGETFGSAMRSLAANKMRSLLTMLGIIIGVTAVVALLAVGNAFTGFLTGELTASGATTVFITPASERVNGIATGKKRPSLTVGDAEALRAAPDIPADAVSPVVNGQGQATAAGGNVAVTIVGAWEPYLGFQGIKLARGEMFTDADVRANAPVVVIGSTVARTLFGDADPVGRTVRVNGVGLRTVAVMEAQGALGTADDSVIVPLSTAFDRVTGRRASVADGTAVVEQILMRAVSIDALTPAADAATALLDARHPLDDGGRAFEVNTVASQLKTIQTVLTALQVFLAAVAGISLLVGGIGIMNIMLVSVTERTREIGVRKAIGAQEGAILTQFIVESVLISLVGALIGVIVGLLIALLVSVLWRPAGVSVPSIIVAVGVAMLTGLVFGVAPARRAAKLKPIEALRTE